jgi:hypothetical protein
VLIVMTVNSNKIASGKRVAPPSCLAGSRSTSLFGTEGRLLRLLNWDTMMRSSGNPLIPTTAELIGEIFNLEERECFEQHLRPIVERGGSLWRTQSSYTWAFKPPIPAKPWPDDE